MLLIIEIVNRDLREGIFWILFKLGQSKKLLGQRLAVRGSDLIFLDHGRALRSQQRGFLWSESVIQIFFGLEHVVATNLKLQCLFLVLQKIDPVLLDVAESIVKLAVIPGEALTRALAVFKIQASSEVNDVVLHLHVWALDIHITHFEV